MSLEDLEYRVEIRTPVYPTEKVNIVKFCLEGIFPGTEWSYSDGELKGKNNSLKGFKEVIKDMRIRDTVRDRLLRCVTGSKCSFKISKQATCNSKVNLVEEEKPLGNVKVTILSDKIEKVIEEMTEKEGTS